MAAFDDKYVRIPGLLNDDLTCVGTGRCLFCAIIKGEDQSCQDKPESGVVLILTAPRYYTELQGLRDGAQVRSRGSSNPTRP